MNELRSKRYTSQIQLLYDEQIYELYEENLENQIKRNKEVMEKAFFMIEKYYLPKKTCLEGILDSILIMEPLFHHIQYDKETLNTYFYSVDQLNFRSSCYQVLQTITDQDVELKSKDEIEKMELFQEFYDKFYQNDFTQSKMYLESRAMDFRKKLEEFTELFSDDSQKILDVTKQLMLKAKQSLNNLRLLIQPETDQAIYSYNIQKQRYDLLREKEVFLKQQILYNDEAFQIEQTQHIQLRDSVDKLIAEQEMLYKELSDENRQNVLNMIRVQNWDIMKNQEEEEFRKQSQKFNPGRRHDYDL
ncbi:unnamed protein product (macronuclear) [Paramecium tetraurelia]|uniref:Uncharacterized protein n=1 Tax=Paramecium tetraurelia TaxID=5888 RepID=A0DYP6_PARTE|nr:uncharacterized protein GSPATT00003131001 [Paramecium tetraurelia]CAK88163.1 unnamed protein product [Paramecium tetraurelia]|eukprot:XP_001455560.1 hypothetical protein (macronuclear) [Paramecium tetraurelia strain d4-2]